MSCDGRGCPHDASVRATKPTVNLTKQFKGHRLAVGATVEFRVLLDGWIGKVTTLTIRSRRSPLLSSRCLPPGARRPQRCASG